MPKPARDRRAKLGRLQRQLCVAADARKPRRVRTKAARYAAALAEQLDLIRRPDRCEWCRRTRLELERHHWDYVEPLVVTFLCRECHAIADGMAEEERRKTA